MQNATHLKQSVLNQIIDFTMSFPIFSPYYITITIWHDHLMLVSQKQVSDLFSRVNLYCVWYEKGIVVLNICHEWIEWKKIMKIIKCAIFLKMKYAKLVSLYGLTKAQLFKRAKLYKAYDNVHGWNCCN